MEKIEAVSSGGNSPRCVLVDDYCHISSSVLYTPVNVAGPGVDREELDSQLVTGCTCVQGSCGSRVCGCIAQFGRNYSGGKLCKEKFNGPIVECNATCACSESRGCNNRLVQFGPCAHLEVYDSGTGKGLAVRTTKSLPCGTFVCEYAGEVIGRDEVRKRFQSQGTAEMNYIFALIEHVADGSIVQTFVDPTSIGNVGRYINHCCDPNCIVVPVRVDSPIPKLSIFASRDVQAGEEVTFDYGQTAGRAVSCGIDRKPCLCGVEKCGRYLPFDNSI